MKRSRIVTTFIFALLFWPHMSLGATIHVPVDQPTIQAGIDAAVDGDLVLVAPGTYVENINFNGKAITFQSEAGAGVTIIDGNQLGSVVTFDHYETEDSILDGFTIRNGDSIFGGGINLVNSSPTIKNCIITENTSSNEGAGISTIRSSPTITNCTITRNSARWGGGIYSLLSNLTITNCMITENASSVSGGGIFAAYSVITITESQISENNSATGGGIRNLEASWKIMNTTINRNTAVYGGGIFCFGISESMEITESTITENNATGGGGGIYYELTTLSTIAHSTISGNHSSGIGGGIVCFSSNPTITNSTISDNQAAEGGAGIYITEISAPTIRNSIISGNSAEKWGGGIYLYNSPFTEISNCVIADNSADNGGGICSNYSDPAITNCTINGNIASSGDGGGIWGFHSNLTIASSILWGDSLPEITLYDSSSSNVTYSNVQMEVPEEIWPGEGNINEDPLFIGGGDYHLSTGSSCIDAGDPDPVYNDECIPPSMGSERNDMGAYGGPGACCWEPDKDGDSFDGVACGGDDCDDTNPDVNPGAEEICDNGIDDDCDDLVDLVDPDCCWDNDDDGFNDVACGGDDCDDTNPDVNPGAEEICNNGIDDDCDDLIDTNDPNCPIFEMNASYEEGTLTLNFTLGTLDIFVWQTSLILIYPDVGVIPLWTVPLPPIDPPTDIPVEVPVPNIGWIGIYSGLYTTEGDLVVDDLDWVYTGW